MVLLLQIIAMCVNIYVFYSTIRQFKTRFKIMNIAIMIFQVVFVTPIIFEWLIGTQDYSSKSPGFNEALNDSVTNMYYSIFVTIIPIATYYLGTKTKGLLFNEIKEKILIMRIPKEFIFVLFWLMFLPFILILISPSPDKYLFEYAYFQKNSSMASESELWFHNNILKYAGIISLVSIIGFKMFTKNSWLTNTFIYTAMIITGILNGKRTLFAFIVLGILLVDIIKSPTGRLPIKKIVISAMLILFIFLGYASLINKYTVDVSTLDNIRLYFFRDIDVKYAIYSLLNSDRHQILQYWGQTYLYNLIFFIPREVWIDKPYPYDIYVTSSALNLPAGTVLPWSFQTSYYGEALANFGWFGICIAIYLLYKFVQISEKTKSPIIILLCLFIIVRSYMNHYGTFALFVFMWLILLFINKIKKSKK